MIDEKKLIEEIEAFPFIHERYDHKNANMDFISGVETMYEMVMNKIKGQTKIGRWIPCSEKMPENEKEVEITYTRKHYRTGETMYLTARAFYENGTLTTEDSNFCWEEGTDWEYVEEKDGYMIPEGWWESVSFSEEFGAIDMPVIAWRCITEPYRP